MINNKIFVILLKEILYKLMLENLFLNFHMKNTNKVASLVGLLTLGLLLVTPIASALEGTTDTSQANNQEISQKVEKQDSGSVWIHAWRQLDYTPGGGQSAHKAFLDAGKRHVPAIRTL